MYRFKYASAMAVNVVTEVSWGRSEDETHTLLSLWSDTTTQ